MKKCYYYVNGRGLLRYEDYSNLEDLFNTLISKLENE